MAETSLELAEEVRETANSSAFLFPFQSSCTPTSFTSYSFITSL
jgi:hypothetical protein